MSIKVRVDLTTVAGQVLPGYINVGPAETLYGILTSDIDHVEWIALNGDASRFDKATIRSLRLVSDAKRSYIEVIKSAGIGTLKRHSL